MDIERIKKEVSVLYERNQFSGCVLLTDKHRDTLFSFACGYASKEYEIPNALDTRFNIASVGKMVTGVAVTQLMEAGKVKPTHPISDYLNIKNDIYNTITVEQALTHTSGLGDYFSHAYASPYTTSYVQFSDYARIVEEAVLAFSPGTKWEYSNLGYLILGMLIENVTGTPYNTYVEQNIFAPAHMTGSGFWIYNEPVKNRATGYSYDEARGIWRSRTVMPVLQGTSSGGWFSTVDDLSKFIDAAVHNKLLSKPYTDMAIAAKPELCSPNYGYGFFTSKSKLSHGGNGTGINAQLTYYKESGCALAVLCNYSNGAGAVEAIVDGELL